MIRVVAFLLLALGIFVAPFSAFGQTIVNDSSASDAYSACQHDDNPADYGASSFISVTESCSQTTANGLNGFWLYVVVYNLGRGGNETIDNIYTYNGPPIGTGSNCSQGYQLANGTGYQQSSTTGMSEYQGCCLSMLLGPSGGGSMVETGASCAAKSGAPTVQSPPAETHNPDGSTTYCDTGSGDCVTYNPNSGGPASSSTSANNSTSSSTTSDPAGSSSSGGGGSGTGSGSGSGSGSGGTGSGGYPAYASSTSCTTGVCDVGNADGVIGTLYTPSTDSPSAEFSNFQSTVQNAPVIQAVNGFFAFNVSGTCPQWVVAPTKYWPNGLSFEALCESSFSEILGYAGDIVLAVAAFAAFRIALY
jgi:hypothetical protein